METITLEPAYHAIDHLPTTDNQLPAPKRVTRCEQSHPAKTYPYKHLLAIVSPESHFCEIQRHLLNLKVACYVPRCQVHSATGHFHNEGSFR